MFGAKTLLQANLVYWLIELKSTIKLPEEFYNSFNNVSYYVAKRLKYLSFKSALDMLTEIEVTGCDLKNCYGVAELRPYDTTITISQDGEPIEEQLPPHYRCLSCGNTFS